MRFQTTFRGGEVPKNLFLGVHDRLGHDIQVAGIAEASYRNGDTSGSFGLCRYLEGRYAAVLAMICQLTELEANTVEPMFTQLEEALA